MRLRTTMGALSVQEIDRRHQDDDRDELQQHAHPHELLRRMGRAAAQHVGEAEQQYDRDGADGYVGPNIRGHASYIAFDRTGRQPAPFYNARALCSDPAMRKKDATRRKPRTIAAQGLGGIDPTTKAVVPPVHISTTFLRDPDNQYRS